MTLPPIIHRGIGLLGVPVLLLCAIVLPLIAVWVAPPLRADAGLPFVAGFVLAGFALHKLDRHAGRMPAEVVDPDSGVRQRVVPVRDSVFFVPLAAWGEIAFAFAVMVLAWTR